MLAIDTIAYRSPWRRIHPGVKATLCGGLLVCALALPAWPGAALTALVVLVVALGPAAVAPRAFLRAAWMPVVFVLTGSATLLISVGGPDGLLAYDPEGARRAAELGGRATAAVMCQLLLVFTTPMAELLPRLTRIGLPVALVDLVSLIYRMLFVTLDTARRIHAGQVGRLGYQTRRSWILSLGMLGSAVFVRSFDRARRLHRGLECRGYTGDLTVLTDTPPLRTGALLAALAAPLLVATTTLAYTFAHGGLT